MLQPLTAVHFNLPSRALVCVIPSRSLASFFSPSLVFMTYSVSRSCPRIWKCLCQTGTESEGLSLSFGKTWGKGVVLMSVFTFQICFNWQWIELTLQKSSLFCPWWINLRVLILASELFHPFPALAVLRRGVGEQLGGCMAAGQGWHTTPHFCVLLTLSLGCFWVYSLSFGS